MKLAVLLRIMLAISAFSQSSLPGLAPAAVAATHTGNSFEAQPAAAPLVPQLEAEKPKQHRQTSTASPMTVLMRTGTWFVYSHGCDSVKERRDVIVHFHGAYTTVIPRYLATDLDAVLVIVNLGLFSGPYTNAYAIRANVDGLLERIEGSIAEHCKLANARITRLALSSWSAGYGAVEQFLRYRPERVDAVLLADGLHVGFCDKRHRVVNVDALDVFVRFARQATRGEKLMSITHSAITPMQYAGTAETAMAVSQAAEVPTRTVNASKHGMKQLTAAGRGEFYVEGYAGNDKAAHSRHLYSIGKTSFAKLGEYWAR